MISCLNFLDWKPTRIGKPPSTRRLAPFGGALVAGAFEIQHCVVVLSCTASQVILFKTFHHRSNMMGSWRYSYIEQPGIGRVCFQHHVCWSPDWFKEIVHNMHVPTNSVLKASKGRAFFSSKPKKTKVTRTSNKHLQ